MSGWVEASVSVLRCELTGHLTPHMTFRGDTDMVTMGLTSLSSITENEIVIAELSPTEFSDKSGLSFQDRINHELNRDDLRLVRLLRVAQQELKSGLSFKDFHEVYQPPTLVFACPKCGDGAVSIRSTSPIDFEHAGGKLTVLADLEIRG